MKKHRNIGVFLFYIYLLLMLSIGFFLANLNTGIKHDINATNKATPNIKAICLNPKIIKVNEIPKSLIKTLLIIVQTTPQPIDDKTKFIIQMIKLSAKKIEKTSFPRAPIALSTPISRFL